MLTSRVQANQLGRAALLAARSQVACPKLDVASIMAASFSSQGGQLPSTETPTLQDHKRVTDRLSAKTRSTLYRNNPTVRELVELIRQISKEKPERSLFGLVEEKLLQLLNEEVTDEDDLVTQFLPISHDYKSLCFTFIEFAAIQRRPAPLLKTAAILLTNRPYPLSEADRPDISILVKTLEALVKLSYPNQLLVTKLVNDIAQSIQLNDMSINLKCKLLTVLGNLRWRNEDLFKMFFEHTRSTHHDPMQVNQNLISTLLYITAQVSFKYANINEFYSTCLAHGREELLDKSSRKWLNHVWSLEVLGIAKESHLRSVFNDEFVTCFLEYSSYTDTLKLLNLRAFAKLKHQMDLKSYPELNKLTTFKTKQGQNAKKYGSKIHEALNGLVKSGDEIRHDIQTPYGFNVDYEILLDDEFNTMPLDGSDTLEESIKLVENGHVLTKDLSDGQKCAIINVLYEDTIMNRPNQVVGHKRIIRNILKNLGYRTIFLPQSLLDREETSAGLIKRIKELIDYRRDDRKDGVTRASSNPESSSFLT